MKFYITNDTKQELQEKIKNLETQLKFSEDMQDHIRAGLENNELKIYQNILDNSITLPTLTKWTDAFPCAWNSISTNEFQNGAIIEIQ